MKIIHCYLFAFLMMVSFSHALAYDLPDLGSPTNATLTPSDEKKLGKEFMVEVHKRLKLVHDTLLNSYITSLGYQLTAHAESTNNTFTFFIVHDSTINAFAGPGGYIGVNSGLILTTQSEDELAAVLAHEIAHVTQRHIAQAIERANKLTWPTLGAMVAAIVIGTQTNNPNLATGAAAAAIAGNVQNMLNFSRSNETEADRVGMQTLYAAGFNPHSMPQFFSRMQQATLGNGEDVPEYLRTHPVTSSRIADAENRANQFPKHTTKSSTNYYLMRARLRVLTSPTGYGAVDYFKNILSSHQYQNKNAVEYGYALALQKNNQSTQAISIMKQLAKNYPNEPIYQMGLANVLLANKQAKEALEILKNNYQSYPDYYPVVIDYANALIKSNQTKQAKDFLQKQIWQFPNEPRLYELLARSQATTGDIAGAYQSRAKMFALRNQIPTAILQIEQALQLPHLDHDTLLILKAKLKEFKEQLAQDR